MRLSVSMLVLVLSTACSAPPEAPEELNQLAGFMFERFLDEDTNDMALGLANLEAWLQANLDATGEGSVREGYTVSSLEPEVILAVRPDSPPEEDFDIRGSSVATESAYPVASLARALTIEEQEDVFPNSYLSHDRTLLDGEACFISRDCDLLDTDNVVSSRYAGVLNVDTNSRSQYRWIDYEGPEGDVRTALLNRTWLVAPAEVGAPFDTVIDLKEQIYAGVILPWGDGGSVRLGTVWLGLELLGDLNEAWALQQMVNSLRNDGETLEEYLDNETL